MTDARRFKAGELITFLNPHVVEEALVRASANLLIWACGNRAREAKLCAAMMEQWTPEFTARVQRRIDEVLA